MAKEELIEMNGVVMEVLPDSRFRVTLDNGHNLVAYTAGKMRKHHIRIIAGDNREDRIASGSYRDLAQQRRQPRRPPATRETTPNSSDYLPDAMK